MRWRRIKRLRRGHSTNFLVTNCPKHQMLGSDNNWRDLVPNAAGTECVTCNVRHNGLGGSALFTNLVFNSAAPKQCAGDTQNGYAVDIQQISQLLTAPLTKCWEATTTGETLVPNAAGTECVTCNVRHNGLGGSALFTNLVFNSAAPKQCAGDAQNGYAVDIQQISQLLTAPLTKCWEATTTGETLVPNAAGTECVTCNVRHNGLGGSALFTNLVFNSAAPKQCAGDAQNGYAVDIQQISQLLTAPLTKCWEATTTGETLVPNAAGTECVTCAARHGTLGVIFDAGATVKCIGNALEGYAVIVSSIDEDLSSLDTCWVSSDPANKVPNVAGSACVSCNARHGGLSENLMYNELATVKCAGDKSQGYAVDITTIDQLVDQNMLVLCWATGYVSDGIHCQLCKELFSSHSIFSDSASNKCLCDPSQGFAGSSTVCNINCFGNKQIVQVDGSVCISCDATNSKFQNNMCKCNDGFAGRTCELSCWNNKLLVSDDGMKCVECSFKFGDGSVYIENSQGECKCDSENGFYGTNNGICKDCWRQHKIVGSTGCDSCQNNQTFTGYSCKTCEVGYLVSDDGLECVLCEIKYGEGSIQKLGESVTRCVCNQPLGYAQIDNSNHCADCWRKGEVVIADPQDSQKTICAACTNSIFNGSACIACPTGLVLSNDGKICVSCELIHGEGSIYDSGICKCNETLGYVEDNNVCLNCWNSFKVVKAGQCVQCDQTNEEFDPTTHICKQCGLNQIFSVEDNQCVCNYKTGYTGIPGNCYCNTQIGFTKIIDPNTKIATCECNTYLGHVQDTTNTEIQTCMCNVDTGHFGDPGNCICNTAYGNIGLPGHCQCNAETHHIGLPGHCECDSVNGYFGLMEPIEVLINYVKVQISTCVVISQDNDKNQILTKDTCFSKQMEVYEVKNEKQSYKPSKKYACVSCYPGEIFNQITNKCEILPGSLLFKQKTESDGKPVREYTCNNDKGFVGTESLVKYGDKCIDCWSNSQIIVQNNVFECRKCGDGQSFVDIGKCTCDNKHKMITESPLTCACDEKKDYIGTAGQCIDCAAKNAHAFMTAENQLVCQCDAQIGYGKLAVNDDQCVSCRITNQIVSLAKYDYMCVKCGANQGVSATDATKCICDIVKNYDLVPKADGTCQCMNGYHTSNDVCSKNSNKSTVAAAVCVPIAVLIIIGALSFLYFKKQQQKKAKVETNITTEVPLPNQTNSDTVQINEKNANSLHENSDKVVVEEVNQNQIVEQADIVLNENIEREDQVVK
ncbi:VSP_with INR [Hexamita inflata]|uniref:VSP with INR n=1 Tax=Hexamita inflata TaxID=28002 RepID=A0AA86NHF5_9EUKA|nr:VSP with INR [Hexamita inflata]